MCLIQIWVCKGICDIFKYVELRPSSALSEADILAVAVEEEYKIFSANKVITTYRYMGGKGFEFTQPIGIFMQARHGVPDGGGEEGDGRVAAAPGTLLFSAALTFHTLTHKLTD